jgi:ribosomal protein S9
MRKITIWVAIVAFLAIVVSGCNKSNTNPMAENPDPPIDVTQTPCWLAPMAMDIDRNRAIVSDYIQVITHPEEYYPEVFKNTKVLKLYIEALNRYTDDDILALVKFANTYGLEIAVEVGGIRMKVGQVAATQLGVASAEFEFYSLNKLIKAGGKVNYITTDHSMAPYLTGRDTELDSFTIEEIMGQMMEYFKYMQEHIPGLKVGTIESLGFFWVKGNGRQYKATDQSLKRLDFESFFDTYLSVAQKNGVILDHFHIDFGYQDVAYDRDYGRILAVEKYVKSKNVKSGFIATNAFHEGMQIPSSDPEAAAISSANNTIKYFEGYIKAGGNSNYLILQRWQPYPSQLGNEKEPYTQMGIFNSIVSSSLFPITEGK